jgi:hypothetical protein
MTLLPIGSDEWWARWSPEQRQRTADYASRRVRELSVWVAVAVVGLVAAAASTVVEVPGPDDLPERPDLVGLVGLSIESVILLSQLLSWRQVGRVSNGAAHPKTLRGLRGITIASAFIGFFTGLFVFFWVALYPAYALAVSLNLISDESPTFRLAQTLLATVVVTAMACGFVAIYGWVPLRAIRVIGDPNHHPMESS